MQEFGEAMFFRLTGRMQDFVITDQVLEFQVHAPVTATIQLRRPAPDELVPGEDRPNARCTSTCEVEEPPPGFNDIARGETFDLMREALPVEEVNTQGELRRIRWQLGASTISVLNTLRWKAGVRGPRDPLTGVVFSYSFDGQAWGTISDPFLYRRLRTGPFDFGAKRQDAVAEMIAAGNTEPASHDLLREARAMCFTNPRSALILGVAALEVGTRWCLTRLVPDQKDALRDSRRSTKTILTRDLPELLSTRGHLAAYAPPRELIEHVDRVIEARHTLVHHFPGTARYDEAEELLQYLNLEETLWVVEDFLWLFDYYAGFEWAINRVTATTKQLLINRNGRRPLPTGDD